MDFMNELSKKIKEQRNIRESSLKIYLSNIKKLYKMLGNDEDPKNLKFLNNKNAVDKVLEDKKLSTKKTYYASIIVILMTEDKDSDLVKKYRSEMEEMAETYKKEQETQQKSNIQKKNWSSLDSLIEVMNNYDKQIKKQKICKKETLNRKEFDLVQMWIVCNLYLHDENPPMRLDYAMMRVKKKIDFDKLSVLEKKNNYLVVNSRNKKYFFFGDYKTQKQYGDKQIEVNKKLNSALNCWLKYNTSGFLLVNSQGNAMNENGLTKYLGKVFSPTGKLISVNMLRHIFISSKFKPELNEKQIIADKMGHSTKQQELYIKKD